MEAPGSNNNSQQGVPARTRVLQVELYLGGLQESTGWMDLISVPENGEGDWEHWEHREQWWLAEGSV